jgi:hypothetical protein
MLEKRYWSDISGALYYVFCEPCHCKGNGANDKETALANFHKELARKEKLALRKPEKILTDIRDYLEKTKKTWKENNEILGTDLPLFALNRFIYDLAEYAEKLGVEL